ncbi:hypothetical protein V2G26_009407 [Clonostachys chloroleuca]
MAPFGLAAAVAVVVEAVAEDLVTVEASMAGFCGRGGVRITHFCYYRPGLLFLQIGGLRNVFCVFRP